MSNIITITDFLDPALDVYARLTENQLVNREHPEAGLFIAESPKVIHRALDAGCVPVSFLVEDRQLDGEAAPVLARCPDTPVYTAPFEVLTNLTGFKLLGRNAVYSACAFVCINSFVGFFDVFITQYLFKHFRHSLSPFLSAPEYIFFFHPMLFVLPLKYASVSTHRRASIRNIHYNSTL